MGKILALTPSDLINTDAGMLKIQTAINDLGNWINVDLSPNSMTLFSAIVFPGEEDAIRNP